MDKYIKMSDALDWFRTYGHIDEPIPFETLVSDLRDSVPAADVAPVVRCRDCVLCRELVKGLYRCEHWGANIEGESPDGFCSAGVTKEESESKMKA